MPALSRLVIAGLATALSFHAVAGTIGLGRVLTTKDGGQIFGFAIDRHGNDGVLASAQTVDGNGDVLVSVETFDQRSGKITKSLAKHRGPRDEYAVDGIFAGDVALVTHDVTPKGSIYAKRLYEVMNPASAGRFTGDWTPPVKDIEVLQAGTDQESATATLFAIELKKDDRPDLLVSDVAAGSFANLIHLDPNLFGLADGPLLAQYTAANKAVFALSPDAGTVGGQAPLNIAIDLATGETHQFSGYNLGEFHAGSVNGLAVDPNTGIAATTTELNSQVEFYDMDKMTGVTAAQLPCTDNTDQVNSGAGIAVDPVHRLFLVTDQFYCDGGQGSAIVVYDEKGNLVETIAGFNFVIGEPPPALNPAKRMGWAYGGPDGTMQLRQFFY